MMLKISDSLLWSPEVHPWIPPEGAEATAVALDLIRDTLRQAEALVATLAELDEANANLRGYSWQPIETAPRDRVIMLYRPGEDGFRRVATGSWDSNEYEEHPEPFWRCWFDRPNVERDRYYQPTHWMNLPEPPAEVTP